MGIRLLIAFYFGPATACGFSLASHGDQDTVAIEIKARRRQKNPANVFVGSTPHRHHVTGG
jgi:hypothetical protein